METTESFANAITFKPSLGGFSGMEARPYIYKHSRLDQGAVLDFGYKIGVQVSQADIAGFKEWVDAPILPVELASTYNTPDVAVETIIQYFKTVTVKPLYLKQP